MLLMIKQAKQSLCPMGIPGSLCAADDCAMWRWHEPFPRRGAVAAEGAPNVRPQGVPGDWVFHPRDPVDGDPACWAEPVESAKARRHGYCGLAGRPEVE